LGEEKDDLVQGKGKKRLTLWKRDGPELLVRKKRKRPDRCAQEKKKRKRKLSHVFVKKHKKKEITKSTSKEGRKMGLTYSTKHMKTNEAR